MSEFKSVIVVRLIFLEHNLNQDTLLLKYQGFPVLMELSDLVFDQVYKILPKYGPKKYHYSLLTYSEPRRA